MSEDMGDLCYISIISINLVINKENNIFLMKKKESLQMIKAKKKILNKIIRIIYIYFEIILKRLLTK